MCCGCSSRKSISGEALLAIIALVGFLALAWNATILSWDDLWMYAGALAIVVVFYFLVLLCRAVFTFMTGAHSFWWEKYEGQNVKMKK